MKFNSENIQLNKILKAGWSRLSIRQKLIISIFVGIVFYQGSLAVYELQEVKNNILLSYHEKAITISFVLDCIVLKDEELLFNLMERISDSEIKEILIDNNHPSCVDRESFLIRMERNFLFSKKDVEPQELLPDNSGIINEPIEVIDEEFEMKTAELQEKLADLRPIALNHTQEIEGTLREYQLTIGEEILKQIEYTVKVNGVKLTFNLNKFPDQIKHHFYQIALKTVGNLLIVFFILWGVTEKIIMPLKKLTFLSENITKSQKIENKWISEFTELTQSQDEVGKLSSGLNNMVSKLVISYQNLEKEREKQLQRAYKAGIAENAVSILHNIGNAITPASVQINVINKANMTAKYGSYITKIFQTILLHHSSGKLEQFLKEDDRGKQILPFFEQAIQEMGNEREQITKGLLLIERQLEHIANIIISQKKYTNFKNQQEFFSPNGIVEDALSMMEQVFLKKNIKISMNFAANLPQIYSDKNKLIQVLINVLKNSVDSIDEQFIHDSNLEAQVKINLLLTENMEVLFQFVDNGRGASFETQEHLFEFGFSTKKSGSGFGLHDCANFIRANKGEIRLSSSGTGLGAILQFTLPIS